MSSMLKYDINKSPQRNEPLLIIKSGLFPTKAVLFNLKLFCRHFECEEEPASFPFFAFRPDCSAVFFYKIFAED